MLQVLRLDEKELALLDITLAWSLDEFLAAAVAEEVFDAPAVSTETYRELYREFHEAIQLLREGNL